MARRAQGHEDNAKEIRELAEKDLRVFAKLVNPLRVYWGASSKRILLVDGMLQV